MEHLVTAYYERGAEPKVGAQVHEQFCREMSFGELGEDTQDGTVFERPIVAVGPHEVQ